MTALDIRDLSVDTDTDVLLREIAAQLAEANELTRLQIEETRAERKRAMQDILGTLAQHAGHGDMHDNPPPAGARRQRRA